MPIRLSPTGRPVRLSSKATVARRLVFKRGTTPVKVRFTNGSRVRLFKDTFTGTGALDAHVPDLGTGWGEVAGTPTISGGKMLVASNGGNARALGVDTQDKFTVTMVFNLGADGISRSNGIRVRYKDNNNWVGIKARRSSTPVCQIVIFKREAGVTSGTLWSVTLASDFFVANTNYTMRVDVTGSVYNVYIDGVLKLTATEPFLAADAAATGFCATFEETLQPSGQNIDSFEVVGRPTAIRLTNGTERGTL